MSFFVKAQNVQWFEAQVLKKCTSVKKKRKCPIKKRPAPRIAQTQCVANKQRFIYKIYKQTTSHHGKILFRKIMIWPHESSLKTKPNKILLKGNAIINETSLMSDCQCYAADDLNVLPDSKCNTKLEREGKNQSKIVSHVTKKPS